MFIFAIALPLLLPALGAAGVDPDLELPNDLTGCPPALINDNNKYDMLTYFDKCYQFVLNKPKEYSDANRACQKNGGTLAMPKDLGQNHFLSYTLKDWFDTTLPVWIGLHDKKKENTFVWEDGEKLDVEFNYFADKNGIKNKGPKATAEDCVALHPANGKWHDYQCKKGFLATVAFKEVKKNYVCEYKRVMD